MATEPPNLYDLYTALQTATLKCSERCLYQGAKWYCPSPVLLPLR